MSDKELFEIAALSVEATTDPTKWSEVCERIGTRCNALFSLVFEFDPVTQVAPIYHTPRNLSSVNDFIDLFKSGAARDEPRSYQAIARQDVGVFLSESELLGVSSDASIPFNSFRSSYFPVVGAKSRGAAKLNDIGPHLDSMSLHFSFGSEDIGTRVRSDIALLGPILGKALEAGRTVRGITRGFTALLDAFDLLDCGATICEADGRILISNQCFRQMTRDGDAVIERRGYVSAVLKNRAVDLAQLSAAASRADSTATNLVIALDRRSGKLPMIVRAVPLRSADVRANETLSLLLFIDPDDDARLSVEGLAAFRILSPAEIEVCELLIKGWRTRDIARERDTSPETARAQIKSASAKLCCPSRLDLVRLALSTRAPLRKP